MFQGGGGATFSSRTEPAKECAAWNKGAALDGEFYEEDEIRAVLGTCSKRSPTGARDRAYLLVLWQAGLRSFEAVDLLPVTSQAPLVICGVSVLASAL